MTIDKKPTYTESQIHIYGRLVECCDVAMTIESGQLKTVEDVLKFVKERAKLIAINLKEEGFFTDSEDLGILNYCLIDKPADMDFRDDAEKSTNLLTGKLTTDKTVE
jgi:hypothetical protein